MEIFIAPWFKIAREFMRSAFLRNKHSDKYKKGKEASSGTK